MLLRCSFSAHFLGVRWAVLPCHALLLLCRGFLLFSLSSRAVTLQLQKAWGELMMHGDLPHSEQYSSRHCKLILSDTFLGVSERWQSQNLTLHRSLWFKRQTVSYIKYNNLHVRTQFYVLQIYSWIRRAALKMTKQRFRSLLKFENPIRFLYRQISLCSHGWPGTYILNHVCHKLREIHPSTYIETCIYLVMVSIFRQILFFLNCILYPTAPSSDS